MIDGAGDRHAERAQIHALYVAHGARIHRFLRDLLGDGALAADALQETFMRAYSRLSSFEEGTRIVPWLFGIARNVSLELRKSRFRAARHAAEVEACELSTLSSPESDLLGREALRIVHATLMQLSEERRAMLLLRLDHGLSYEEIAETMGRSLSAVKVEIFRARQVLRAKMAEYDGGAK